MGGWAAHRWYSPLYRHRAAPTGSVTAVSGLEEVAQRGLRLLRLAIRSTGYALWGSAIGLPALFTIPLLILVAVGWFLRIGAPLVSPVLRWVRWLADLERERLRRWGHEVKDPYGRAGAQVGARERLRASDRAVRRDLAWLPHLATWGLILGVAILQLLVMAVHDITYPLWWQIVDPSLQDIVNGWVNAESWSIAGWAPVIGLATFALWVVGAPWLLGLQTRPGLAFLRPSADADLSARVTELAATRAAALDAHAVELRRIERALHDGAQNRIVGAAVLVGAARREVVRDPGAVDPERVDEMLSRAQDTIEDALAELRSVVRSILPPVLENRGLEGALSALAADCPVPCTVVVDVPVRCPVSVETTAYFMVAEALTNVARHSEATSVGVEVRLTDGRLLVRVTDDGHGGADATRGSGLAGIVRRVEAHDGVVTVSSPVGGPTEIRAELPCES